MPEQEKPFHILLDELRRSRWGKVYLFRDAISEAVGCDERTVRNWRSGKRTPEKDSFEKIEKLLFGAESSPERTNLRRAWEAAVARRGTPGRRPLANGAASIRTDERPPHYFGRKRKDQVRELAELLEQPIKLSVIVLGDGGIGKTTFKREVTYHDGIRTRFGSRIFEARLETAPGAAAMQEAIATAAGLDPRLDLEELLNGLGRAGPSLLLLDNLETPWDAEARLVEALLRSLAAAPEVSLLASLRWRVAPLGPLWARQFRLSDLEPEEARAMFCAHAPFIAEDDPHLAAFLAELGGNPLALRLVAGRAAPHEALADLWADWQALGPKAARDSEAPKAHRHASLANSIEFSLASRRLDERGRRLFRLLGVLPAGLAREDRVALLGLEDGADGAHQLLRLGLADAEGDRLDLLPPIRRHALAHHKPQGEDITGWARHLLVLTAGLENRVWAHGGEVVARLRPELPNLEAALRLAAIESDLLSSAKGAIWTYTVLCSSTGLGGLALQPLAEAYRSANDPQGEANCIMSLGDIARSRSDHAQARERYEAAMPLYKQVGDLLGEANCIRSLGDIARSRSDHAQARERYEAAMPLYKQVGNVMGEANALTGLADIDRDEGRIEEARAGYRAVLEMEERIGAAGNAAITRARLTALDK